jgi:hypothetical protein
MISALFTALFIIDWCAFQAWINGNVRQALLDSEVDLGDLLVGKAHAFVRVHSTGMLDLVTSSTTIKADMLPETLLFDLHRLAHLQVEFQLLTTASTMLISAANYLNTEGAVVARIGEEIFAPLQEMDMGRVMDSISGVLEHLPTARKQGVTHVLMQCSSPADMVHKIMARRMRTLLACIMQTGQTRVLQDTRFMQAARPMFVRIEQLATKLTSLSNLNRTVHLPTYNKLIGEAALGSSRRPVDSAEGAKRTK